MMNAPLAKAEFLKKLATRIQILNHSFFNSAPRWAMDDGQFDYLTKLMGNR